MKTENGDATEYVYNALNQLVSDSKTTYEYDLNGNLIRVIGTAHSALYEYNSENKLVRATVQNGVFVTEESYTYDYAGNRTSKTTHKSNGEFEYVKYLNDNSSLTNVLAEIDENGTVKCVYTIGADLVSQERDGKVSVYIYDGHGSIVGLANENGAVTDTYCYDAFGNLLKSTGSTKNCYRYCGEQFDETTGLYYLCARYMDTSTGRFISQDTYQGTINDPVSLHKYLYANSNPVMYSDPSGYITEKTLAGVCTVGLVLTVLSTELIVANYLGVFDSLINDVISAEDNFNDFQIKIQEVMLELYLGIQVCVALCQKIVGESISGAAPGDIKIWFSMLFSCVAAYVYWQLLINGNKYGNEYEHHHIVAQNDPRAFLAQMIFEHLNIDINDNRNLVWIKKAIHKFLHINEYFLWINKEIGDAYFSSLGLFSLSASREFVFNRLAVLKTMLYGLNKLL